MDDLISRRDAIDAMKDMYRAAEKWLRDATDDVTKARAESCMASLVEIKLRTEKLPVVQPDHNADISKKAEGDCISRQAAIDLFPDDDLEYDTKDGYVAPHLARRMICELSSAQPERKKPVFKTGESVYHVSYADGTGGFEKNKWADWTCPDCGWFVGEQYIPRRHNQQKCNYCAKCGCAIDWSDADMRGEENG